MIGTTLQFDELVKLEFALLSLVYVRTKLDDERSVCVVYACVLLGARHGRGRIASSEHEVARAGAGDADGTSCMCRRRSRGSLVWWRAARMAVGHERTSRGRSASLGREKRAACGHGGIAGRGAEPCGYKSHHPPLC